MGQKPELILECLCNSDGGLVQGGSSGGVNSGWILDIF